MAGAFVTRHGVAHIPASDSVERMGLSVTSYGGASLATQVGYFLDNGLRGIFEARTMLYWPGSTPVESTKGHSNQREKSETRLDLTV